MASRQHTRFSLIGPGGFRCPCCAPQSGDRYSARARWLLKKQAKNRDRAAARKEVEHLLHDSSIDNMTAYMAVSNTLHPDELLRFVNAVNDPELTQAVYEDELAADLSWSSHGETDWAAEAAFDLRHARLNHHFNEAGVTWEHRFANGRETWEYFSWPAQATIAWDYDKWIIGSRDMSYLRRDHIEFTEIGPEYTITQVQKYCEVVLHMQQADDEPYKLAA